MSTYDAKYMLTVVIVTITSLCLCDPQLVADLNDNDIKSTQESSGKVEEILTSSTVPPIILNNNDHNSNNDFVISWPIIVASIAVLLIIICIIILIVYTLKKPQQKVEPTKVENANIHAKQQLDIRVIKPKHVEQLSTGTNVSSYLRPESVWDSKRSSLNSESKLKLNDSKRSSINSDYEQNVYTVRQWLHNIVGLEQYYDIFISNGYDSLDIVKEIPDNDTLKDINITDIEHQIKLLNAIKQLNDDTDTVMGSIYNSSDKWKQVLSAVEVNQKLPAPHNSDSDHEDSDNMYVEDNAENGKEEPMEQNQSVDTKNTVAKAPILADEPTLDYYDKNMLIQSENDKAQREREHNKIYMNDGLEIAQRKHIHDNVYNNNVFIDKDVPNSICMVRDWLKNVVGLEQYYDIFMADGFETLELIAEIEFVEELEDIGIMQRDHQRKLLEETKHLREHPYNIEPMSPVSLDNKMTVEGPSDFKQGF